MEQQDSFYSKAEYIETVTYFPYYLTVICWKFYFMSDNGSVSRLGDRP